MNTTTKPYRAGAAAAPRPMPFAIMRNTLEALRASIRLRQGHLDTGARTAFVAEWRDFRRALAMQMAMEDEAMFALLDEVGAGAITAAALPAEHAEDTRLAAAVDAALASAPAAADFAALRAAWTAWKDDHLHHLEHEEAVTMPLTLKTVLTPHERARVVNEKLLTPFERRADFAWFVGWVVGLLSRHGSTEQPPKVATRVFAWGLQHASSREQWRRLRRVVQQAAPPALWTELTQQFGLDGDGRFEGGFGIQRRHPPPGDPHDEDRETSCRGASRRAPAAPAMLATRQPPLRPAGEWRGAAGGLPIAPDCALRQSRGTLSRPRGR